ncbi:nucleoside phosphorylase domain-containing protein [Aspergillus caelatus]|uniref:Nucleoside phosphorylase domain-containing protein n=1 Tax=Aspergillus caelatus TaxID=61420 RepID=A0A5N7A192_9EURO|nr:nucleoside phosphorylase domain-containing protein [Aspergillus caelatus]KAE8363248.1 nucleoside phosphorylase domain-containing protein [Aspergillus caelatus]
MRPSTRDEFKIAIICALPVECDAVLAPFDETFDKIGPNLRDPSWRRQLLSQMPGMGKVSATGVASNLCISFPGLKLALVVGICGAIILGDVVSDCIVEYDFGRQYPDGLKLRETRRELEKGLSHNLRSLQAQNPTWQHPRTAHDVLFEDSYRHRHYQNDTTDLVCEMALLKDCKSLMCAGNPVIRERHEIRIHCSRVIEFEMEGAGVCGILPYVIIKGVCDYADNHKDTRWQRRRTPRLNG